MTTWKNMQEKVFLNGNLRGLSSTFDYLSSSQIALASIGAAGIGSIMAKLSNVPDAVIYTEYVALTASAMILGKGSLKRWTSRKEKSTERDKKKEEEAKISKYYKILNSPTGRLIELEAQFKSTRRLLFRDISSAQRAMLQMKLGKIEQEIATIRKKVILTQAQYELAKNEVKEATNLLKEITTERAEELRKKYAKR